MRFAMTVAGYYAAGAVLAVVAIVAASTALAVQAAGLQFALGVSLLLIAGFGAGLLTMYAYVSSLGWERR